MTSVIAHCLTPDWPAPANVVAWSTTRLGGVSEAPFDSFNPASHVGDRPHWVQQNRRLLFEQLRLPSEPFWLEQVHGVELLNLDEQAKSNVADGSYSTILNHVCLVQTADCLPVLFCDRGGKQVAAVHAGWRGLQAGILERAVSVFKAQASELLVWLGPAISKQHFEVGEELRQAFVADSNQAELAFKPAARAGHYWADLYLLARMRLQALGVEHIYGGDYCSYADSRRFFSYRRDGRCGRMATLIYLNSLSETSSS